MSKVNRTIFMRLGFYIIKYFYVIKFSSAKKIKLHIIL